MGFGDSVQALLETYTKCLTLLHAFGRSGKGDGSGGGNSRSSDSGRQSVLSRSLRSDRAKVRQAYTSRLSEAGSGLQKGDDRSRSALRRVVQRLADALARLLSGRGTQDGRQRPRLDYDALRALSNASRVDAIQAMDDLAVRLESSGSRAHSMAHSRTSRTSRTSRSSTSQRHHHRSAGRSHTQLQSQPTQETQGDRGHARQQPRPDSGEKRRRHHSRHKHTSTGSSSSGSTKLGEIPESKWPRRPGRYDGDGGDGWGAEAYNVRPTYPVRPFGVPAEKKKGFWSFMRST